MALETQPYSERGVMMSGKGKTDESSAAMKPIPKTPRTWWQWFLVYPALLIAIVSSIPTYIELIRSKKLGVPFGESAYFAQQEDLWVKNITCLKAPLDWYKNEYNIRVDATICKSGDILIWVESPNGEKAYRWVSPDNVLQKRAAVSSFSEAYAAEHDLYQQIAQINMVILCQKVIAPGRVKRRIQTSGGCYDEIIDTYTGTVLQRNPAPCDPNC